MSKGITLLLLLLLLISMHQSSFLFLLVSKAMGDVAVCFWNRSHQTSSVYSSSNESPLPPSFLCALPRQNVRHNKRRQWQRLEQQFPFFRSFFRSVCFADLQFRYAATTMATITKTRSRIKSNQKGLFHLSIQSLHRLQDDSIFFFRLIENKTKHVPC